jgi:hypothetical protein
MPAYSIEEFIQACRADRCVDFWGCAKGDAKYFGAFTQNQRLRVIFNAYEDGLLKWQNTKPLDKRPNIIVDAYCWERALGKPGYLAFYRDCGKWWIKSLKESDFSEMLKK